MRSSVVVSCTLSTLLVSGAGSAIASIQAQYYQDYQSSSATATPPGNSELVVIATAVQIMGADPQLQQVVRRVIRTRPGGETSQKQLQQDVAAILQTGFFSQARVSSQATSQGLQVTYWLVPGVVRSLQLIGAEALTPQVVEEILAPQIGQPISPTALEQATQQINEWYARNGYPLAQVLSLQPSATGVVTVQVAEGRVNQVRFQFLNDQGRPGDAQGQPIQGQTREDFLRRQIQLKPGQLYQQDVVNRDIRQLYQLGLFNQVTVTQSSNALGVDVTYNLLEAPASSISPSAGFNEVSGIYGVINYNNRNIGGVGQQYNLSLQIGQRDIQFYTNFISPYRASDPDTLGYRVDGFRRRGLSDVLDDKIRLPNGEKVQEGRLGGGVTLLRSLGDWQAALGLNFTRVSIRDGGDGLFPVDQQGNPLSFSGTGIDDLYLLSLSLLRDQRDNSVNASRGNVLSLSSEQSLPIGFGSIVSNRLQASYVQYIPLTPGDLERLPEVFVFNLQGGTNLGDLPPYRAFSLGGLDSVRGYNANQVGSGRSYFLASSEYRFPLFAAFSWPVGGVVFADFGTDLGTGSTVPGQPAIVRNKPGTGFGYGLGLRIQSPIGILRADFGFNDRGENQFQFGIGQRY